MASQNVIEANDLNFDAEVLRSSEPVLVDFGAAWCGPCKVLAPVIDKLANESAGAYKVAKVDIDDSPVVAQKYGIRGVPTIIAFKDGLPVAQHVGLTNAPVLLGLLGKAGVGAANP